jgi:hypothetical protein
MYLDLALWLKIMGEPCWYLQVRGLSIMSLSCVCFQKSNFPLLFNLRSRFFQSQTLQKKKTKNMKKPSISVIPNMYNMKI